MQKKKYVFITAGNMRTGKVHRTANNRSWCLLNGVIEDTIYTILTELLDGELIQNARNG
jgi:hypothetical protein